MGTNFYWIARDGETCEQSDEPRCHIGKRSAAGQYCWDCGVTLCQDGTEGVHHTHSKGTTYSFMSKHTGWYDECPACGAKFEDAGWKNAAGVELGFSKSADVPRRGVSSCSSFTWTKMAHKHELQTLLDDARPVVVDEYGQEYTARQFLTEELASVAIETQYYRSFS